MIDLDNFDFRKPDYPAVLNHRIEKLNFIKKDPVKIGALMKFYKTNPWNFITDWGVTFDPRTTMKFLPFILFPRQTEYMKWVHGLYKEQKDGLVEKSRDSGMSWLNIAYATTLFLFEPGYKAGFGSRKEALVDKLGDSDSLLEKGRIFRFH